MQYSFDDKDLYTIAVMRYKEKYPNVDDKELFTIDWNMYNNYKLKNYILAEAIKNNVKVEETETYKNTFNEGCVKKIKIKEL